jgi:hypothetical protein
MEPADRRFHYPTPTQETQEVIMGLSKLAEAALVIVLMAAAIGQLPRLNQAIRIAQIQLVKDSQSSKWRRAMLLPVSR